jgi:hypothetical protein
MQTTNLIFVRLSKKYDNNLINAYAFYIMGFINLLYLFIHPKDINLLNSLPAIIYCGVLLI